MSRQELAAAWAIARRDYRAAVWSRLFVLFLLLPLVLGGLGAAFGAVGASSHAAPARLPVAVADDLAPLVAARTRLAAALAPDALPPLAALRGVPRAAIARGQAEAVLSGGLAHPRLLLSAAAPDALRGQVALLVGVARAGPDAVPAIPAERVGTPPPDDGQGGRVALAQGVQYAMLLLTVMLAGRLLSSFIEERSNKVIEILAAAVPVDAIFLGKLLGMLLFSLTCVVAWGGLALAAVLLLMPGLLGTLAAPAVGWPAFVALALVYFSTTYLLLGAVLLGIGAHAGSPSDVQTLALPTTFAQLGLFALASLGVGRPDSGIAHVAAIFPWSSALAMAARAAEVPALWPHAPAMLWQAAWLWLTVRLASARFRRAVLKSGPPARRRRPRFPG